MSVPAGTQASENAVNEQLAGKGGVAAALRTAISPRLQTTAYRPAPGPGLWSPAQPGLVALFS